MALTFTKRLPLLLCAACLCLLAACDPQGPTPEPNRLRPTPPMRDEEIVKSMEPGDHLNQGANTKKERRADKTN